MRDMKAVGRIAGLTSYAVRTPAQEQRRKEAAAAGRMRQFLEQVPAEITDPAERQRRALALQRAHMTRIAQTSAAKRRKKAA
jgi:hypothetical protein